MMNAQIDARIERWRRLLNGDPSLRYTFLIYYEPDLIPRPLARPELTAQRLEWAWDKYRRQMNRIEWLADDLVPYLDCLGGTEIFAEAFGCPVHYPPDSMPFAMPLVHSAAEAARLKTPDLDAPSLRRCFDFADALIRRTGRGALLRIVDVQSPLDIVGQIWEKGDLYMAMIESPQAVRELAEKTRRLLTAFLDEWFSRYGRAYIAHCPEYYMDGGLTLSEDEVGAVGAEVFMDLFLPELTELSRHFGELGVHCCANARHQWNGFKQIPGLKVLNIHQPKEVAQEALEFFGREVIHYHGWMGDGPAWEWPRTHPAGTRAILTMTAKTRDQAMEFADRLRRAITVS